jgi:murein DD-endopeptidase MepM/ murein hydrolase activator NlpD
MKNLGRTAMIIVLAFSLLSIGCGDELMVEERSFAISSSPDVYEAEGCSDEHDLSYSSKNPLYTCRASDLVFSHFPLDGKSGRDWMINNYVDLARSNSYLLVNYMRDYKGYTNSLARTYNQHRGVDIDIPTFREMDSNKAVVRAVAPGTVIGVDDSQFDRNMTIQGQWNFVSIRHTNGFVTIYGHLKQNSATVSKNDVVSAGTILGVAGSSGRSTQPHLHFEVQDCRGECVESFEEMWTSPVAYDAPSDIMDLVVKKGYIIADTQIKNPTTNVSTMKIGDVIGVGLSLAAKKGDIVSVSVLPPTGTPIGFDPYTIVGNARYRHMYLSWYATLGTITGKYALLASINGTLRNIHYFTVTN